MGLRQVEEVGADEVEGVGCCGEFGGEQKVEGDCGEGGVAQRFGEVKVVLLFRQHGEVLLGMCTGCFKPISYIQEIYRRAA